MDLPTLIISIEYNLLHHILRNVLYKMTNNNGSTVISSSLVYVDNIVSIFKMSDDDHMWSKYVASMLSE
jgi:hypothetical protein